MTSSSQPHFSHLTYHSSSTSHHNSSPLHFSSQLITAPLFTPHLSHLTYHILTSHITYHITTHHSSTSHTSLIILSQHNSSQLRGQLRLPFGRQAQYTDRPGGAAARMAAAGAAAAFRVAGPVHRASWRSCGAWPPLGPRLPFAW